MFEKFLLVVVFVAIFAAVQGGGENEQGMKVFKDCLGKNNLEWKQVMQAHKKDLWCDEAQLRSMSACVFQGVQVWDGENLSDKPAIDAFGVDSEEYKIARKCFDVAETKEKDYQPCELMICCKKEGCGKQKRSKRSINWF